MSVIVSNCSQICGSPLNKSKSKALYSFPKQSRFKSDSVVNCATAFYDIHPDKDNRTTSLGYGHKYDFTAQSRLNNVPGPNTYSLKGDFEAKRGCSFGIGREKMKQNGIIQQRLGPGPGQYECKSQLSKTAYSLRSKTQSFLNNSNVKIPGPGAYQVLPSINEKGKYVQSKFSNSGATIINPPSSKRFPPAMYTKNVPGPGQYDQNKDSKGEGNYVLSKYKTIGGRSFTHGGRKEPVQTFQQTPGPGTYRLPSEFGYYENKNVAATTH